MRDHYRGFHSLFFLTFVSIFLLFIPVATESQENNIPSITSITVAVTSLGTQTTAVDLIENTTTTVYIHGSASDADSCEQIDAVSGTSVWKVVLYRSNLAQAENCTADNTNCYQDTESGSDLTGCDNPGDTTLNYEMDIPVSYYADATDTASSPDYSATNWTAYVQVTDDNSGSTNATSTVEVNTLKALDVSTSVNYGTLDLAQESVEQSVVVSNTGNDNDLDPLVSDATGWTCTIGTFGAGQVTFHTTALLGWAAGTPVSSTPSDLNNLSVIKSTGGANPTGSVYLNLKLPATGAGGTCSSTLTIGAN